MNKASRYILRALGLAAAVILSAACEWRELDYDYIDTARFKLIFDWSKSSLNVGGKAVSGAIKPGDPINGRTAVFFPADGGAPILKMSHSDTMSVNLLVGDYYAAFFNETYDDFDNISFTGTGSFEQLQAVLKEDSKSSAKAVKSIFREPDILSVETLVPFTVTEDMVKYTRAMETRNTKMLSNVMGVQQMKKVAESMTVTVTPQDVVYPVEVDVVVHGMDNITSAGVYITGFAGGFDFSEGKASRDAVTHKVNLSEKVFEPGSDKDGLMKGYFTSFGLRGQDGAGALTDYSIEFRASLIDGTVFSETRSINDLITQLKEDGHLYIQVYVGADVGGGGADPPIIIPDVEPVGGDDGMWHVNVGDWDEVVVPIGL